MIISNTSSRKRIACFFLALLFIQSIYPSVAWALTSGPAQPEAKQFMQAGTSDMVDLSTGNFKYNIPLLDVEGYPINLNYQSGIGMDDEASWVGLGWNLNTGAVNRQLRGLPDDSYGDSVLTSNYMKPKITVGARLTVRGELFGNSSVGLEGSLSVGIFSDNYTGIGAEVGANAGLSLSLTNSSAYTPGIGLGLGVNSNTSDGVSVTPSVSLSLSHRMAGYGSTSSSLSMNLGYNTREGLKSLTLGSSFSFKGSKEDQDEDGKGQSASMYVGGVTKNYNTPPFYPKSEISFKSANYTFSGDIGGTAWGVYGGVGVTGYKTKREVKNQLQYNPTYGFLYAEKGKDVPAAMMDFMREKDNPVDTSMHNLALPVATPDLFSYTSQAGGGQIRLYRNHSGVFFDNRTQDVTDNTSASVEYGAGAYFHGGVSIYNQDISSTNGKWQAANDFLAKGDFVQRSNVGEEEAYFKHTGEQQLEDPAFFNRILGERAVSVPLDGKSAQGKLRDSAGIVTPSAPYKRSGRQIRNAPVMYLTAGEAAQAALDKKIRNYAFNVYNSFATASCSELSYTEEERVNSFRKDHHISEMMITGGDGKRMVYGLPVYNKQQVEYSFATNKDSLQADKNIVKFPVEKGEPGHVPKSGGSSLTNEYFHKEVQPAYATSYLLTAILSPDYVDVTGDGVSEDDRGTAIKFNYSKVNKDFHWRTPYGTRTANYNRSLNADPDDDKASFVYGEKELRYLHSIETKNMIAYFITADRMDALGCDLYGNMDTTVKQKYLKEIRLYARSNLKTPVKTVVFEYDSSLCQGIPNSIHGWGKLTLKKVYFKYASSGKGEQNAYSFNYNDGQTYAYLSSDRWGTLKPSNANSLDNFSGLANDEFPYTTRDSARAAQNASMWHLSEIKLPSGGVIKVTYESDDYAYVQNRLAMEMVKIAGMLDGDNNATTSLRDAKLFQLTVPKIPDVSVANDPDLLKQWFINTYLNGSGYLYAKVYVNLTDDVNATTENKFEFVPVYGKIASVKFDGNTAIIGMENDTEGNPGVNPFISAAWQRMRLELPRYAYPGYNNRINDDRPVTAAVKALGNSIKNLSELWENFNKKAYRKKFAAKINLNKSFVRIAKQDKPKLGGGVRVKRIKLQDEWAEQAAAYGQEYEYTTIQNGQRISSGVASYEPAVGGDENPMRLPVAYTQDVKWGLNNYFYLEEPMGESFFPAPQVVYREVKVKSLGANGVADEANKTGWLTYEFYTAKEFPVRIEQTMPEQVLNNPKTWANFFGGKSIYELTMSQGYAIFLNDMHGRAKAERVFNQSGQEISATEYYYNATEEGGTMRLSNVVDVVDETGKITKDQVIGREIEMFADMRQSEMNNTGKSINLGIDVIPFGPWVVPLPHFPWSKNDDYRLFRSASIVKTIEYTGVVSKVVKRINGSSITSVNVLFDKNTGGPVVTQSENEFNDPVYTTNIPAYWMYKQMGMAYQNLGLLMDSFTTDENALPGSSYLNYLSPGDELIDVMTGMRMWVVNSPTNTSTVNKLRVIEASGRIVKYYRGTVKICRSGYRNLLGASAAGMTTLQNPVSGNVLKMVSNEDLSAYKVLNASAMLYAEAWGQAADCNIKSCPEGYIEGPNGDCMLPATPAASGFDFIPGDYYKTYGIKGAYWYDSTSNNQKLILSDTTWKNRLKTAGVWLKQAKDNTWWGIEKCIDVPVTKNYYIGHAGDDLMRIYVDGRLIKEFTGEDQNNQQIWNIRQVKLPAGKHVIRMDALNLYYQKAAAIEIYNTDSATLRAVNSAAALNNITLFSTKNAATDNNLLAFYLDPSGGKKSVNYRCSNGATPAMCDGTPNCGFKPKGACPDGYTNTADGQACIPNSTTVSADTGLLVAEGNQTGVYSKEGAVFYNVAGTEDTRRKSSMWGTDSCQIYTFSRVGQVTGASAIEDSVETSAARSSGYCGMLNATGIWLSKAYDLKWIGVEACLKVPESKWCYIGYGADNMVRIYIDGMLWREELMESATDSKPFVLWNVRPVYLSEGQHIITIEAYNSAAQHAVGVEVYNNTLAQLNTDYPNLNRIFSTNDLLTGKPYNSYVKNVNGVIEAQRFTCSGGPVSLCDSVAGCPAIPNGQVLNPYVTGYLGNWLPWKEMVWLTSRTGQELPANNAVKADIRNNGAYQQFSAYWFYNNGWGMSTNNGWVVSNTIGLYDEYAQEQETKNALGIYSAVRFGFKSSLPVAIGANMRQREIFYDGFDDYKFNASCVNVLPCKPDEFDIRKALGDNYVSRLDSVNAHSGNYSLKLSSPINLKTYVYTYEHTPGIYLNNNQWGEYLRKPEGWLGLRGFCPVTNRRYIFTAWVRDGQPASASAGITLTVNNNTVVFKKKAVVEGWKLVEGNLEIPTWIGTGDMAAVDVTLSGGANVSIDDIRIFPYDGQLKTFTYDDKNMRVMAELDENNYATFYEYDDEGSLIRVKKETERGIMTIKENRSALRKN
ncbi:hypothetical protein [[Flexibacter] sp. ATCC 35208]|uniref:hypothetical protein n=1 Tax=[Flexibacter] sp. ATCC 35208 TaxID=1936242 RepID=UPI0009D5FD99|nr:hypothetical protein [[Flexibacter] sp. ATCC 35208]OMP76099.1 hypothetical protein BW716_26650 [[Flexibacter] sp. ATCC 35208]